MKTAIAIIALSLAGCGSGADVEEVSSPFTGVVGLHSNVFMNYYNCGMITGATVVANAELYSSSVDGPSHWYLRITPSESYASWNTTLSFWGFNTRGIIVIESRTTHNLLNPDTAVGYLHDRYHSFNNSHDVQIKPDNVTIHPIGYNGHIGTFVEIILSPLGTSDANYMECPADEYLQFELI